MGTSKTAMVVIFSTWKTANRTAIGCGQHAAYRRKPATGRDRCMPQAQIRNYVEMARKAESGYRILRQDGVQLNRSDARSLRLCRYSAGQKAQSCKKRNDQLDNKPHATYNAKFLRYSRDSVQLNHLLSGALNCGQIARCVSNGFARSMDPIVPPGNHDHRVAITTEEADAEKNFVAPVHRALRSPVPELRKAMFPRRPTSRRPDSLEAGGMNYLGRQSSTCSERPFGCSQQILLRQLIVFKPELGNAPRTNCLLCGCGGDHEFRFPGNLAGVIAPRTYTDHTITVDEI